MIACLTQINRIWPGEKNVVKLYYPCARLSFTIIIYSYHCIRLDSHIYIYHALRYFCFKKGHMTNRCRVYNSYQKFICLFVLLVFYAVFLHYSSYITATVHRYKAGKRHHIRRYRGSNPTV